MSNLSTQKNLPEPILPLLEFPEIIKPNTVNINRKIMNLYTTQILGTICEEGDDEQYGSSATCDINVLQALSKRIHYGKYVAEAKFQSDPATYTALLENYETDKVMDKLTNLAVEEKLLSRVAKKASTYGQEIDIADLKDAKYKVPPEQVVALYKNFIIPLTKEVQIEYLLQRVHGTTVAFLGPRGTFSEQAGVGYFETCVATNASKKCVQYTACKDIHEVFSSVLSNKALYGVVPIENSQTGIIHNHMELLIHNPTKVCGEIYLPIRFYLMANCKPSDIKKIYSHAQGLQQCRKWLTSHFPDAELIECTSTAKSAEIASQEPNTAAVCNLIAGQHFKLGIVGENIQDTSQNTTRFLIICKHHGLPTVRSDKTILTFGVGHTPGALLDALQTFSKFGVNLTRITSYTGKKQNFEYIFYVEFEGSGQENEVTQVLTELRQHTTFVQAIGSFPSFKIQAE